MKQLRVSVRSLIRHSLRSGDLAHGFSDPVHPLEATKIHRQIQESRPDGYQREVTVSHQVEMQGLNLEVKGRIDGVLKEDKRTTIEEIKTCSVKIPSDNQLHWAQAKIYAHIYALDHKLSEVDVRLTYFLLKDGQEHSFTNHFKSEELEGFFSEVTGRYIRWRRKLDQWCQLRNQSINKTPFPFTSYRTGQREMAVAVYRTIRDETQLLLQAPTGIGKTMAAIFPSLKAIAGELADRLFYLTARTTGKSAAEKTLSELRSRGTLVKSLTLTAKRKICFNPEAACTAEECSFAEGFYDRLEQALQEVFRRDHFSREVIEELARSHHICPFELSLELALWVDCVICDYNYIFDPRVSLKRSFQDSDSRLVFAVDEAHNLPDRAREMFSAAIEKETFLELKRAFQNHPQLSRSLGRVSRELARMRNQHPETEGPIAEQAGPSQLYPKLSNFLRTTEIFLLNEKNRGHAKWTELLDLYYQTTGFMRVRERYDSSYTTIYEMEDRNFSVTLYCVNPSSQLGEIIRNCQAAILFSATLTPLHYFQSLLGCGEEAYRLRLPSPFPNENLLLAIADKTSTIYRKRIDTSDQVTDLLQTFIDQKQGHYLVFFPSYEYLALIHRCLSARKPGYDMMVQTSGMSEAERDRFISEYAEDHSNSLVGFAVMGGIFGEGIDLVGEHLTGAAVVGVGLPAITLRRELVRKNYSKLGFRGFDYAYLFPGLNRVLQAAGRVIRSETDRGAVLLIDDRYAHFRYQTLLPSEWNQSTVYSGPELRARLERFWLEQPATPATKDSRI